MDGPDDLHNELQMQYFIVCMSYAHLLSANTVGCV